MRIEWLGEPVPKCPPGHLWSPTKLKCVNIDAEPEKQQACWQGQVWDPTQQKCIPAPKCPAGWTWSSAYGECLPPQNEEYPVANCPEGTAWNTDTLRCDAASTASSPDSSGGKGTVVAGLAILAIIAAVVMS